MKSGIYKITNPNNKIYIGQSTNIKKRFSGYKNLYCTGQPLLYNSFFKYGFDNHKFEIICICTIELLNDLERFFIKHFNSNDHLFGLNLTTGGQDYWFHTPETKLKMSEAQKGNKKTLGRKASNEEIQKRIEKNTGKKRSIQQRENISKGHLGTKHTIEQRKQQSINTQYKNAKKVIDISTGVIYHRVGDAAIAFNIKKSTLTSILNGTNKRNLTNLKYLI